MKCPMCNYEYPNGHLPLIEDAGQFWLTSLMLHRHINKDDPQNDHIESADMYGCPSCKSVFIGGEG